MARYEFICHDCKVIWEKNAPMAKAPKTSKCPECKKKREQNYTGQAPGVIFKGDWMTNKHKMDRFHKGHDKALATEIADAAKEGHKKRMDNAGQFHYAKYSLNEKGLKHYGGRRLSDKEVSQRNERRKELTLDAYKKIGKDPSKKSTGHNQSL